MNAAEHYLRDTGVAVVKVGVLAKNTDARNFYSHLGYRDYELSLIKNL